MKSEYTLYHEARYSDEYPVGAMRISSKTQCGAEFDDIGAILEPYSPNPCLYLKGPLGINGVMSILREFKIWKERRQPQ